MDDIFNLNLDDFKPEEKKATRADLYKPDPKGAPGQVYKAIIRFVPNINDARENIVRTVKYWLTEGDSGFYADCPSSIGEKSIISDTYWKLKKSNSAYDQKNAELLARKENWYSYIYVVKDFQNPALDGTIQVFRFPKTLYKMIQSELTPDEMAMAEGKQPVNVFDLFKGKDFQLQVRIKAGYNNYDLCKFAGTPSAITIGGVQMKPDTASKEAIKALYPATLQPLSDFKYQPWTPDLKTRVLDYLSKLTNGAISAPADEAPEAPVNEELRGQQLVNESGASSGAAPESDLDAWLSGK